MGEILRYTAVFGNKCIADQENLISENKANSLYGFEWFVFCALKGVAYLGNDGVKRAVARARLARPAHTVASLQQPLPPCPLLILALHATSFLTALQPPKPIRVIITTFILSFGRILHSGPSCFLHPRDPNFIFHHLTQLPCLRRVWTRCPNITMGIAHPLTDSCFQQKAISG